MRAKAYTRALPMLPALASVAAFAAATRVSAPNTSSPVIGHVSVNANNTSAVNTIGVGAQPIGIVVT
jgi:hypothetical protein